VALNRQESTHFSMERGIRIMNLVWVLFVHKRIISAVRKIEFVSDRMSYIILRGRWCHVIVLNVHAETEVTVHCKLINFVFQIFPLFISQVPAGFTSLLFRLSPFILLGSCNRCSLACLIL
jgi:hypothetical protein